MSLKMDFRGHDWSSPYHFHAEGPILVLPGCPNEYWRDAESYFKKIWYCAEHGIDFWVQCKYSRVNLDCRFECVVRVSSELRDLLLHHRLLDFLSRSTPISCPARPPPLESMDDTIHDNRPRIGQSVSVRA